MAVIEFVVVGKPIPQGSKVIRYRGRYAALADDNANELKPFRRRVAMLAHMQMQGRPLMQGPVQMRLVFKLYRPKNASKANPPTAAKKPDNDKLQRAVYDALTGVVYRDDAQVVDVWSRKMVAEEGEPMSVQIAVRELSAAELAG